VAQRQRLEMLQIVWQMPRQAPVQADGTIQIVRDDDT
jgi:hypothetical protein